MAVERDRWSDERLDDLSRRMDNGFNRVDADMRALRSEMNARFETVDARIERLAGQVEKVGASVIERSDLLGARLDAMTRTIIVSAAGVTAAIAGGFVTFLLSHA